LEVSSEVNGGGNPTLAHHQIQQQQVSERSGL